jgi:hypothetical protein
MYKDVQNSNNVDKQMLNQLVNENVIVPTQNKIQKGQFLLPFFFISTKNISDAGVNLDSQEVVFLVE